MQKDIKLEDITIYGGTQTRAATNDEAVVHYAERMEAGDVFPPLVVFFDGSKYWLADGFHRFLAAKRNEVVEVIAEVQPGGRTDALEHALGANATNGLYRSNADKRHAVEIALEEWAEKSNGALAEICAVSVEFVRKIRNNSRPVPPASVTGRDGKQYPAQVERQPRGESSEGGGGGGGKKGKKEAGPTGGTRADLENTAMEMERKGEMDGPLGGVYIAPSTGAVACAREAIETLEKIARSDPDWERAVAMVASWLAENQTREEEKEID